MSTRFNSHTSRTNTKSELQSSICKAPQPAYRLMRHEALIASNTYPWFGPLKHKRLYTLQKS